MWLKGITYFIVLLLELQRVFYPGGFLSKIKGIGCLRESCGCFVYSCFYALGEWGCWSRSSAPISPKPLYRGLSPVAPILHIESPTSNKTSHVTIRSYSLSLAFVRLIDQLTAWAPRVLFIFAPR